MKHLSDNTRVITTCFHNRNFTSTMKILGTGIDTFEPTVQIQIRLKKQSDQVLHCLIALGAVMVRVPLYLGHS